MLVVHHEVYPGQELMRGFCLRLDEVEVTSGRVAPYTTTSPL